MELEHEETPRPTLPLTTDYDALEDYMNQKALEHQEMMIETENYYAQELDEMRENLVDGLDEYLSKFAEDFIARHELDEKLEAVLVARALKGFLTVKLPDELLGRVRSRREWNETTVNEQIVQLIEAGLEATEND